MVFLNECNCIFDEELLEKAVDTYCRRNNVYCHKEYRITIHNTYPTIVISRKHLYVHDLLRTILFHVRDGYVVHHIDFNKLNNLSENLAYISHSKHSQIHSIHNWQEYKAGNITIKRDYGKLDIPDEDIRKMRRQGIAVKEIAKIFDCHSNTIYRRMEKWKGEEY